jgi:hypothetical protein
MSDVMGRTDGYFWAYTYDCHIMQVPALGHLCGYVRIPKKHPLHGLSYDEVYNLGYEIEVHGGLTYSASTIGEATGMQYLLSRQWYFGFDCAHSGDIIPGHPFSFGNENAVYRDYDYVKAECESLARQLKTLE